MKNRIHFTKHIKWNTHKHKHIHYIKKQQQKIRKTTTKTWLNSYNKERKKQKKNNKNNVFKENGKRKLINLKLCRQYKIIKH